MAPNTHLFLREAITTFTAKEKIIQETDICFKENRNSKLGLSSTSGFILEHGQSLFNSNYFFSGCRKNVFFWTYLN